MIYSINEVREKIHGMMIGEAYKLMCDMYAMDEIGWSTFNEIHQEIREMDIAASYLAPKTEPVSVGRFVTAYDNDHPDEHISIGDVRADCYTQAVLLDDGKIEFKDNVSECGALLDISGLLIALNQERVQAGREPLSIDYTP